MSAAREVQVAVLGAGGTIAGAIVRDLAESEEVASLRLFDLDADRAGEVAERHGRGRARAEAVDAREESALARALEGCDVLVNSASYRVNLEAMDAALRAGCHYLDLGGLYWMTARQLELHDEFTRAGKLALLGMGSSPGKTNVMAVAARRALGTERLDEAHVAAAGRDPAASEPAAAAGEGGTPARRTPQNDGPLPLPYALQTLLDELTLNPVVVADGRPREIEPLRDGGPVRFPDPIGVAPTINTLHSELLTFPDSFGCREVSFRLSLAPAVLGPLKQLAGATADEVEAASARVVPPSERTISAHVVEARAGDRHARVSALTRPMADWGLGGGVVSTAAPAAAAVRLLARGRLPATGVMAPESCVDPDDLFPELERRNCTFAVEAPSPGPLPTPA